MSKTLHEIALENLISQGLTKGSKVRVIAKAKSRSGGWENSWVDPMDCAVGEILEVYSTSGLSGVGLVIDSSRCDYGFPAFCLELVSNPPKPVKVPLNSNYVAEIFPKYKIVKVGCQDIPFENVKKLFYEIKKLEKQ